MTGSKKYALFLHNRYSAAESRFYLKHIRGAATIAVDGGIRFFLKNRIKPDILLGDFDSAPRLSRKYLAGIEIFSFPSVKDKTDSQLALELALSLGADHIEICGAVSGDEIDHTLGNIFLLELVNKFGRDRKHKISARLLAPRYEIALVENGAAEFSGRKNDFLSIIPLSANPVVRFSGLIYPAPKRPLRIGDTISLRNQLSGNRARVAVEGKAAVIILH